MTEPIHCRDTGRPARPRRRPPTAASSIDHAAPCPAAPPTGRRTCASRPGCTSSGRAARVLTMDAGGRVQLDGSATAAAHPSRRWPSPRAAAGRGAARRGRRRRPLGAARRGRRRRRAAGTGLAAVGHRRRPADHRHRAADLACRGRVLPAVRPAEHADPGRLVADLPERITRTSRAPTPRSSSWSTTAPTRWCLPGSRSGRPAGCRCWPGSSRRGSRWSARSPGRCWRRSACTSPTSATWARSRGRSRGR